MKRLATDRLALELAQVRRDDEAGELIIDVLAFPEAGGVVYDQLYARFAESRVALRGAITFSHPKPGLVTTPRVNPHDFPAARTRRTH